MANGTRESCHMAVHSMHSSLPHCVVVGIAIKLSQCCLAVGCFAGPRLAIQYLGKASDSVIFFSFLLYLSGCPSAGGPL